MAYIDTDDFLGLFYVASAGQDKQFINTVEMVVSNTPAADVTKIKHAKWEICCDGYYPYCSNCKTEPQGREMTDYCPHCGAKMDGHKKMTNYDRIKAMSTEEMAEFICPIIKLNVLIACEESQRVCVAFREKGHNAFSCDILPCSGGHPEWHIQGDVLPLLNGNCGFVTQDGKFHKQTDSWDLIIAHPPCTRLCNSGQRWLYWGDEEYRTKKKKEQEEGIEFFMQFTKTNAKNVAIENPSGIMSTLYRKPDFTYNPYDFEGETECKKTCIWLIGDIKPLKPTQSLPKELRTQGIWKANFDGKQYAWNSPEVAKLRSKTPVGVAKAMAEQWG